MNNPFTPSADDTAIEMLTGIFGPAFAKAAGIDASAGGAATSMLSESFRYFNSGVLFFGAIIMMYVTVFGVVNTANDGEALGKKWSTFYTPLRTFSAAALLLPTSSGYAAIQLLMFYIVAASIGFASNLWQAAATFMLTDEVDNQIVSSVVDDRTFETLATNIIRMQVCARAIEKAVNATSATPIVMKAKYDYSADEMPWGMKYQTRVFYEDPNWGSSHTLCGTLNLGTYFMAESSNSTTVENATRTLQTNLNKIRQQATLDLFSDAGIKPLSDAIIAAAETDSKVNSNDIRIGIAKVRVKLTEDMRKEIRANTQASQQPTVEKLTKKGWMWAGSLHMELARVKDAVQAASKTRNDFTAGPFNLDSVSSGEVLQAQNQILAPYKNILGLALSNAQRDGQGGSPTTPQMPAFDSGFTLEDFAGGGGNIKSSVTKFFKSFGDGMVSGVVFFLGRQDKNVIWQVKDLGDYIVGYTEAGMVASAVAISSLDGLLSGTQAGSNMFGMGAILAPIAGAIAGIKRLFVELHSIIKPAAYALLYLGYMLGIWLPAVPFVISALAAVGWVIACLETFIAGSLWMAAHITPAREDSFIGSQTQGYLLLMSLFFRPALIVFGLIASMAILNPLVHFINQAFILFFRVAQADSLIGLLSVAGFILLYCVVIFSVFILIFTLPQQLPDRILKWIGAGTGDVGESGAHHRIEHGASSQARGAMMAGIAASASAKREKDGKKKDALRANPPSSNKVEGHA